MRLSKNLRNVAGYLLFLLLLLKSGGGLFLHDCYHIDKNIASKQGLPGIDGQGLNCTCAEDFYIPFEPSDQVIFSCQPRAYIYTAVQGIGIIPTLSCNCVCLRGPPHGLPNSL